MDVKSINETMRAQEFIKEAKGKMSKRLRWPTRGLNRYTDADRWSSDYKLYRLGLALACTDGDSVPDVPEESWVGRWKTLHPYSKREQDMINSAAKAAGVHINDVNKGDMESKELPNTNIVSPVSNWNKKK